MSVTKLSRKIDGKKHVVHRAQVYVRGVRLNDRLFDTKAAAHAWHDEEKKRLTQNPNELIIENQISLAECVDKYLEWARIKHKISTIQNYEVRLHHLKWSMLWNRKVRDIHSGTIDIWLEWLKKEPTAANPGRKSFEKELKLLSIILNWYRNYKDATYVVPITKRHREISEFKPVAPRRPDYFARPEEIRAWIGWLKNRRKPVYAELATFMILTGCRVGEAAALQWDAVDLKLRMARITRTIHWDHKTRRPTLQDSTKTDESTRVVLLPDVLIGLLEDIKARSDNPIVFPGLNGSWLKYNAIQSRFNAGFEALNLPWRSTHICRHTYATMALFATRDLTSVQASLGHKSRDVTEKYAKAVALLSSGTAEKTANVFGLVVK
jgi:integrase